MHESGGMCACNICAVIVEGTDATTRARTGRISVPRRIWRVVQCDRPNG